MATKLAGCVGKVASVGFTSLVAPVLVAVAVQDFKDEQAPSRYEAAPHPLAVTQVIVRGVGPTPEQALQDALYTALRQAAAQVGTGGRAPAPDVRPEGGLILRWRELAATRRWSLRGTRYHKEVAVDVDCRELAARLGAAAFYPAGVSDLHSLPAGVGPETYGAANGGRQ